MKRLLLASCLMLGFTAFVTAQTPVAKAKAPATAKTVKKDNAPAASATVATKPAPAAKPTAATSAKSTPSKPIKADGTPDMRYKENKEAAKPVTGPKKADGTPDMRYKENKVKKAKG